MCCMLFCSRTVSDESCLFENHWKLMFDGVPFFGGVARKREAIQINLHVSHNCETRSASVIAAILEVYFCSYLLLARANRRQVHSPNFHMQYFYSLCTMLPIQYLYRQIDRDSLSFAFALLFLIVPHPGPMGRTDKACNLRKHSTASFMEGSISGGCCDGASELGICCC